VEEVLKLKITIKALLVNVDNDKKLILNNLMKVFCSSIRYSFKRILEGNKIGDIEKSAASKYELNIRQAKDSVEDARQIIASQSSLVRLNYENYSKKICSLEKQLANEKISSLKRSALLSKLDKRKRKQQYLKSHIESNTIPPVIFGGKDNFIKRCKGLISHEQWEVLRSNRIYSRGDKTKKGNPNLRVIIKDNMTYLEVSTLERDKNNRALKIQVPIYLPQKLSKKTSKINGINYRQIFLDFLKTGSAYQVEVIRKEDKYYVHLTFEAVAKEILYKSDEKILGIDTNPDGFAVTIIDSTGNYRGAYYLREHELLYARSNRRENLCGEIVKKLTSLAKENNCGIAVEDLKFKDDKDVKAKISRVTHQFVYSKLLTMLEASCIREGIELIKVKPQYTSKIGLYKYCHQYGLCVHNGAALVIGRRAYGFKEKVPEILIDKFAGDKENFSKINEWKKWSIIHNSIKKKMKEVKSLSFWITNRKKILDLSI
jgi:IS605 OrfB family transposase